MKDKSSQQEKDVQEGSALKTAGPGGEITAGLSIISLNTVIVGLKSLALFQITLTICLYVDMIMLHERVFRTKLEI
jgi:hypothetical protein